MINRKTHRLERQKKTLILLNRRLFGGFYVQGQTLELTVYMNLTALTVTLQFTGTQGEKIGAHHSAQQCALFATQSEPLDK